MGRPCVEGRGCRVCGGGGFGGCFWYVIDVLRIHIIYLRFEPDMLVGSADTTVNLWDTRSNSTKPIQSLTEATDTVSCLHVHMPTYSIASGSYDGRVRVYDLRNGVTKVDVMGNPVTSVRFSQDGNAVLASSLDGWIRMIDRDDGKILKAFGGGNGNGEGSGGAGSKAKYRNKELRIRSVFAQRDGTVLSGSEASDVDGKGTMEASIFAWDVLTGEVISTVRAGDGVKAVSSVAWNEAGRCWAASCSDGKEGFWHQILLPFSSFFYKDC